MKITLELYHTRYTVETVIPELDEFNGEELKELFSRLMVVAGYSPSVIDLEDGGRYEYIGKDFIVIKKEELKNGD